MTLEEAIKELIELQKLLPKGWLGKYVPSIGLGIEALKRLEYNRGQVGIEYEPLLPGETRE